MHARMIDINKEDICHPSIHLIYLPIYLRIIYHLPNVMRIYVSITCLYVHTYTHTHTTPPSDLTSSLEHLWGEKPYLPLKAEDTERLFQKQKVENAQSQTAGSMCSSSVDAGGGSPRLGSGSGASELPKRAADGAPGTHQFS